MQCWLASPRSLVGVGTAALSRFSGITTSTIIFKLHELERSGVGILTDVLRCSTVVLCRARSER